MPALLDTIDPTGLEEFSVVFTDRSLNHMSVAFQGVMNDISSMLQEVYAADAVVVVPGGGPFGMEAVARQYGRGADVLVVRNGRVDGQHHSAEGAPDRQCQPVPLCTRPD